MDLQRELELWALREEAKELRQMLDRHEKYRDDFREFVLAMRQTFAATNGRIPTQYLDAFISRTWPHMRLKEDVASCVQCQAGDGDHIHNEDERGTGKLFLEDEPHESNGFGD